MLKKFQSKLPKYLIPLFLLWTILVTVLLLIDFKELSKFYINLAKLEASSNFNKDVAFRFWAASHGGVYVPITDDTPPNEHLSHIPERDIKTPSGRSLTLMNPAYMLRQLMMQYYDLYGIKGHITALSHFSEITAPDNWEKEALKSFKRGEKKNLKFSNIDGKLHLRFMKPLYVKKGCLKCHDKQGYKIGDVRGGVSISIPMTKYLTQKKIHLIKHSSYFVLLWIVGFAGIFLFTFKIQKNVQERDLAHQTLNEAYHTIEIKIKERTFKLIEINKKLEIEIKKHNQAEAIIKEKEFYLIKAQEIGKLGHFCYNPVSNIVDGSTMLFNIFDVDPKISEFEAFSNAVIPEDRSLIFPFIDRALKEGISYDVEYRILHKNGDVRHVRTKGEIISTPNGDRLIGIVQDITEHKLIEENNKRMEEQLRQSHKMEAIGTLTGGVAHDFNNILGIILGNTEFVMNNFPNWNTGYEAMNDIKQASLRARDIIKQLLTFCRKPDEKIKPIKICQVINDSIKLLRSIIPRTIYIQQSFHCEYDNVIADPAQVNQVIINLCTNAVDAMLKNEGTLTIELKNISFDETTIHQHENVKPGKYIYLIVRDTGHGIPPEIVGKIFDPYFTTKKTDSKKGTGLGLSVVHGIIKGFGGNITVESAYGKGTIFKILIPVTEKEIEFESNFLRTPLKGNERILFIDDEELMNKMGKKMLSSLGYQVETKVNPLKALELFKRQPDQFDIVITDMTMAEMTGDRFAKELLKIRPDIPIILCTGYNDLIDEIKTKKIGIKAFLMKPFDQNTVAQIIRNILDES